MGWARKAGKYWRSHGDSWGRSECGYKLTRDRFGNTKMNTWDVVWGTSRSNVRWAKQRTNGQQRAANKDIIAYELYEDEQWQEELWEIQCGWEDDDIDLPDWWYGIEDDYEYPEPEPEEDHYDPYWYDDHYSDCYY